LLEAQYTREFDAGGNVRTVALSLEEDVEAGLLQRIKPESTEEMDWYVRLARELDDGEAQALAIAKVRGFVLLTDDAKAARIAKTTELEVETTSTAAVLKDWLSVNVPHRGRIHEIVTRITVLARYRPPAGHAESEWWATMLRSDVTR
jgi:predicted nucleic acid-binding protein